MNSAATGQCNCGSVRFSTSTELTDVYVCHCSICRRATGSGGIAVTVVKKDTFAWTKGAELVKTWTKPGHDWQCSFCTLCGSPLPGINDENTNYIPVGLLSSGDEKLVLKHHIFVGSKAGWETIGDDGIQHQGAFRA